MKRRQFIRVAGLASAGTLLPAANTDALSSLRDPTRKAGGESLKAKDVAAYLRSISSVTEPSVDRIVIGDRETEVGSIGTAWLPDWDTCRQAVRDGVNLLVVHEPTFYTHWDLDEKSGDFYAAAPAGKEAYIQAVDAKKKWILENKLVIIRCHDVLDKVDGFGIPHAFGEFLGYKKADIIRSRLYYNVYRQEPKPAIEVAQAIARKLTDFRQPGVAFYGDKKRLVDSVGVGTGCYSDPIEFLDLAPGLFIAIDDVVRTWTQTIYAKDTGHPLVVINHGTSEEAGVRLLAEHLRKAYPDRTVIQYAGGCTYDWITARKAQNESSS